MRASVLFSLTAMVLAGCAAPPLYHYHTDEFRSPPGKEAADIGYSFSEAENTQSFALWNSVANDLIDSLESQYGVVPQMLYLVPHHKKNAFINAYDHALRSSLTQRGYTIVTTPIGVPDLYYEAVINKDYDTHEDHASYNSAARNDVNNTYEDRRWTREDEYKDIRFRLTFALDQDRAAVVKGSYVMPSYGYDEGGALYKPYWRRSATIASPTVEPSSIRNGVNP